MDLAWQTVDGALDRIRKEVRLQREKSNSLCKQRTAHDWQQGCNSIDILGKPLTPSLTMFGVLKTCLNF